jgi:hypothetical protein
MTHGYHYNSLLIYNVSTVHVIQWSGNYSFYTILPYKEWLPQHYILIIKKRNKEFQEQDHIHHLIMTENVDFFYIFPTLKRLPVYIIGMNENLMLKLWYDKFLE